MCNTNNMEEHIQRNDKKIDDLSEIIREHIKEEFSRRELEHYFTDIKSTLERIEAQVIKTNGRVTLLEFWKENLMAKITMILATAGVLWVVIKEFILKK